MQWKLSHEPYRPLLQMRDPNEAGSDLHADDTKLPVKRKTFDQNMRWCHIVTWHCLLGRRWFSAGRKRRARVWARLQACTVYRSNAFLQNHLHAARKSQTDSWLLSPLIPWTFPLQNIVDLYWNTVKMLAFYHVVFLLYRWLEWELHDLCQGHQQWWHVTRACHWSGGAWTIRGIARREESGMICI